MLTFIVRSRCATCHRDAESQRRNIFSASLRQYVYGESFGGDYFLGLIHLPPMTRDSRTKTMAIHENAVLLVESPMVRKTSPRTRKIDDAFLRFMGGIILLLFSNQP